MLANMVSSLLEHESISTTTAKARELRRRADNMITFAKRGDLHARRQAARRINEPEVLQKLFAEIGPRYADRPGGYTRILRLGARKGDNAELAILELVDGTARPTVKDSLKRKRARRILEAEEKAEAKAALSEAAEEKAAETTEEEPVEQSQEQPEGQPEERKKED